MQKFAKFISITRIPGSSYLKSGIKNCRTPRNAVAGGNGSFVVYERAIVNLTLELDGKRYSKDIYFDIKDAAPRKINITDNLCDKLEAQFKNFAFIVEDERIINIEEAIVTAFKSIGGIYV